MISPSAAHWRSSVQRVLLVMLLVVTAGVGYSVVLPAPAHAAATVGAGGAWNAFNPGVGWLGNSVADNGMRVYCIDPLVPTSASGKASTATLVTDTGSGPAGNSAPVSGDDLRRMNYAISVHGQTSNDITAAAVSAYVYNFVSVNNRGRGERFIGGPVAAAVRAEYERVKADTEANFNRRSSEGVAVLTLSTDPHNHYLGELRVEQLVPHEATGSVTLTNAVFADTGLATRDGVSGNAAYPIRAVPPSGVNEYRVSAEAVFHAQGPTVYEPDITIYSDGGGSQRSASNGTSQPSIVTFGASSTDPEPRSTEFRPVVGTQVASRYVAEGEELVDVLRFSLDASQSTPMNEWYTEADGSYARVVANASIYGPFLAQPLESDQVPANAPLAFSGVTATTRADAGPDTEYTVTSGFVPDEPGFYTWVWNIDSAAQAPETRLHLPDDYAYQDRFGQVLETSVRPSQLAITTQLTQVEAALGSMIADEVTVSVQAGGWLQADGARIPVTVSGTAYFSETLPELAEEAPSHAERIGELSFTTDRPGSVMSDSFRLPVSAGFVTFQWCIRDDDQPESVRGMVAETCDLYGQTSETVHVQAPQVTTQAKPIATVHDELTDTAIVHGLVPEGAELSFGLYKQPEVGDARLGANQSEDGPGATWTESEVLGLGGEPVCLAENRVALTEPVTVEPGAHEGTEVVSPAVHVSEQGTYWWVEELTMPHPDTGEAILVHAGECGLPNETTLVAEPRVTTQAVEQIEVGGVAHDVALVEGVLPAASSGITAELTFQAFRHTGGAYVCDASTIAHDLTTPIAVDQLGSYVSEKVTFEAPGIYYWVETLSYRFADGSREVVHVGECGLPNERTTVLMPALAHTGAVGHMSHHHLLLAGGAMILAAAAVGLRVQANRVRRQAHERS